MNLSLRSAAALVLTTTLALSLAACSGKGTTNPAEPAAPSAAETKPTETSKPADPAKPADAAKPVDTAKPADSANPAEATKPAEPPQPAAAELNPPVNSLTMRWEAGLNAYLQVYGTASAPDLHLETRVGSTVIGQADVQVKEGRFFATLNDPGVGVNAEVWISTLGPNAQVVAKLSVPLDRHVGTAWSANFQRVSARQLDPQTVQFTGLARTFEGVFKAEIRVNGQLKGSKQVKVAQGAPTYSPFDEKIVLDQPLPQEGVELYLVTESPKDGSEQLELFTNVPWGK